MKAASFIASRIFSLSKEKLSSTVMRLAVASVALGIAIMLISIAVVTGFKHQVRDKVIGFVAPIQITSLNQNESFEETPFELSDDLLSMLDQVSEISHYQEVGNKAGMVKTDNELQGVVMRGVSANYDWNYFNDNLVVGKTPVYSSDSVSDEVLISKNLADKLLLQVGDFLRVWFVNKDMKTRGRRFVVTGIFETGLGEFDERYIFCDLNQIRKLNGWADNEAGVVEVWLDRNADIDKVNSNKIYFSLPVQLTSYTAMQSYPYIFDWLALLDANVFIIIALMLLVSGITVISMLLIIILERTATIGLLKAMGADNILIRKIFLFRSTKLLFVGLIIGNALGLILCFIQQYTNVLTLNPETYYLSAVPIELNYLPILLLNVGTLLLWVVMLFIPTMVINRIIPSKSIRFE